MKALILDIQREDWDRTQGMTFADVETPVLDESKSPEDSSQPYRICGHVLLGEIVETGSYASHYYRYRSDDIVSTESHIFCGKCH